MRHYFQLFLDIAEALDAVAPRGIGERVVNPFRDNRERFQPFVLIFDRRPLSFLDFL